MNQRPFDLNLSPLSDTPVSFGIILVCALAYLTRFQPAMLALWPTGERLLLTMAAADLRLLHGSFNHLFFNMFAVWMFGTPLEKSWGSKRFTLYFATCVAGAAALQLGVQLFEGGIYPPSAPREGYSGCCWPTASCGPTTGFSCCSSRCR